MGNFTKFKTTKSLKLFKNRPLWFEVTGDSYQGGGAVRWYFENPPKINTAIVEGTLIFEHEDTIYRYYHINTSEIDNQIIIFQ